MENKIKLSVIIPHFQSFDLLERCLLSIPVNDAVQVIVVDDNSPDKVRLNQMISKFSSFLFVRLSSNGGAGKARNEGMKLAQGKWLLFADADDYFLPNAFEHLINQYENEADVVHFKTRGWDVVNNIETNRYLKLCQFVDNFILGKRGAENCLRYRWPGPCAKMIRKSLVDGNKIYFDEIRYSNDVMFSIKVGYYAKTVDADSNEIYCIIESSNSLTKRMDYNAILCRYEVMCRYNSFLKSIRQSKCQAVVLRFYFLALRFEPKCIIPMIKCTVKYHINIFAGLNKCFEILNSKIPFSHF